MFARPAAEYVKRVLSLVKELNEPKIENYLYAIISHSNAPIIFTADSISSSSTKMLSYTYKLFCEQVSRLFGLPIMEKRQFYRTNSQTFAPY